MADIENLENVDSESSLVNDKEKIISKTTDPEIALKNDENGTDMSKSIPNVVQTIYDMEEASIESAQVIKPEVTGNTDQVSETNSTVISKSDADTNPSNSLKLISKWKRNSTQGSADGGGQSLPIDNSRLDVAKNGDIPKPDRSESLLVPANLSADSKLLNDRRDSKPENVKGSKISLLSSVSARSMQMKTDFTIQMPVDDKRSVPTYEDSWIRVAVPYLPLWLAVICLLLNILICGSGTIISGLCIFCCAKSRVPPKYDQDPLLIFCVNLWVGLAQLFTVTFLLVGWFWSVAWGIRMVILSVEHRRELREQRAMQLKQQTIDAFARRT